MALVARVLCLFAAAQGVWLLFCLVYKAHVAGGDERGPGTAFGPLILSLGTIGCAWQTDRDPSPIATGSVVLGIGLVIGWMWKTRRKRR